MMYVSRYSIYCPALAYRPNDTLFPTLHLFHQKLVSKLAISTRRNPLYNSPRLRNLIGIFAPATTNINIEVERLKGLRLCYDTKFRNVGIEIRSCELQWRDRREICVQVSPEEHHRLNMSV